MPTDYPIHPVSLRAMRLFLGLLLLSQAAELARDLAAIFELQVYPTLHHDNARLGITIPDSIIGDLFPIFVYVGLPLFGLLLSAGIGARLASLGGFILLLIIQHFIPLMLQGGDVLLRLLLFWSIFLPEQNKRSALSENPLSLSSWLACWAFTLQICFVYWFAAALKTDPVWTRTGDALFYALNLEHFTTPLGLYFRQFHDLLRIFTFATRGLEFLGPLLLLSPLYRPQFRMLAVVLFISFHLIGMQSLLRVGIFPWVCATAWVAFMPGFFWQWLGRYFHSLKPYLENDPKKSKKGTIKSPFKSKSYGWDYAVCVIIISCFIDILAWNLASLFGETGLRWMNDHDVIGYNLGLRQEWNMYAPRPRTIHGWLIVPADLADGTQVDLITGQQVSTTKPCDIGAYMGDDHWRRYLSNLFDDRDPQALRIYADYLIHRWNRDHLNEQGVQSVSIIFMREDTDDQSNPQREVLYFSS
jgi:Vitamin K-dependent gamma-carboxylase